MSNTETGGTAFPSHTIAMHEGMTLRDYFAAKAMQGAIASSSDQLDFGPDLGAAWAYQVADAMLKARKS